MKAHKFISTILHPILIPTIGVMLYFLLITNTFISKIKFTILGLVFITTYLIPILVLVLLKKLKLIESYQIKTIKERKIPIGLMIILFYILANTLNRIPNLREIALLFYATSLGLFIIYFLFYFKIKSSIHLLSMGIILGFFMVLSSIYSQSFLIIIITALLFAGILGRSRLYLEAHNNKEIYIAFFTGVISPLFIYYIL
ncbi:hypothetical protein [uncultured Polaribacter sp.]|uniref:hypothetical protein n=1 Tax=uncultured Polaribacter sp. TaxID=174711 RepID=UPI0026393112|nr:hypothetical protein [uncultured Polaribacter sp.]